MDRRRFVPSSEGLEGRALLSLFGSSGNTNKVDTSSLPLTALEKEARIQRLPFYLDQIQPGRFLPPDAIANLQSDLSQIAGVVPRAPHSQLLDAFNRTLRDSMPKVSLSVEAAAALNHAFGVVLKDTGMDPAVVERLQDDMTQIAKADTQGRQPSFLATNDYATVLQATLGIGRPIARPGIPELATFSGTRVKEGVGVTRVQRPVLVGSYLPGTTNLASPVGTTIEAFDEAGNLVGSALVDRAGKYEMTITTPLSEGTHVFRVRAVDIQGLVSNPSVRFVIRVVPGRHQEVITGAATPKGPAGQF
jgi:hypothetical protein